MENPENPNPPEKKILDDSLKLLIREEVENEVQKRVKRQEWFYWSFLGLFVFFVGVFAYTLWHVQLSELPKVVQQQLAEDEVIKAKDRIMEIKTSAEAVNQNLNNASLAVSNILATVSANQEAFTNRLNEIKQQDDVVLKGDLSKLFVIQRVTNLVEGQKIILDYDAIPQTIHVTIKTPSSIVTLPMWSPVGFSLEGNNLITTNEPILNTIRSIITNTPSFQAQYQINVDYVRKSLR